jgi:hypothetical protein
MGRPSISFRSVRFLSKITGPGGSRAAQKRPKAREGKKNATEFFCTPPTRSKIRPLRGALPFLFPFALLAAPPRKRFRPPKFLSQQRSRKPSSPRATADDSHRSAPPRALLPSPLLATVALLFAAGPRSGDRPVWLISPVLVNPSSLSL